MLNLSLLSEAQIRALRKGTKLYCVLEGASYSGNVDEGKWYTLNGVRNGSWTNEVHIVLNETGDFGWKPSRFEINNITNYKGALHSFEYYKKEIT